MQRVKANYFFLLKTKGLARYRLFVKALPYNLAELDLYGNFTITWSYYTNYGVVLCSEIVKEN